MADVSRQSWIDNTSLENVRIADRVFVLLNKVSEYVYAPGYTQSYIGVRSGNKPCNFFTVTPQKKDSVISIRVTQTAETDAAVKAASTDGTFQYKDGWYGVHLDPNGDYTPLIPVLLQAEKEFKKEKGDAALTKTSDWKEAADEMAELEKNAQLEKDAANKDIKEKTEKPREKKYWVFIEADAVRAYKSDEETAKQNYIDMNDDFEGELTEAIEEIGESEFVLEYMADNTTDYFTRIHKVSIVPVESDMELSDYYRAHGDGFDYAEYEEGYFDYSEDISPSDFSGLVGWKKDIHNVFVYEVIANNFDIEDLCIYSPENVEYEGDSIIQINVDGEEGEIEIYKDGVLYTE